MNSVFVVLVALAISMLVIPVMWRAAPMLGLMDRPDARKVHTEPVPRVGGWGIVCGALTAILIVAPLDPLTWSYVLGCLILFAFGVWDDMRDIGHYIKFVGQILAVSCMIFIGGLWVDRLPFMSGDNLPASIGIPFTMFAMVGAINAINHSDGLDGLAGGESLLSLLVIGLLAFTADDGALGIWIAAAATGGILGFLRFNTYPAKVFMGDAGSQFLGFTLAFLVILLTQRMNTAVSAALPLLLLGLPIMDILGVLVQRIHHRMNWFKATRNHVHHRLLDLGFDHYEVVVIIYSVQAVFVIGAFILRYELDALVVAFYFGVCAVVFGGIWWAERTGWRAHQVEERSGMASFVERMSRHPLITAGPIRIVAIAVPLYILAGSVWIDTVPRDFGIISAVVFGIVAIEVLFGRHVGVIPMRIVVYVAAIFIVYLTVHTVNGNHAPMIRIAHLLFYALIAIAIGVAVRYSREVNFTTTPTDYLIVFGIIAIGIFAGRYLQVQETGLMVVKAMILLYGCELLINRMSGRLSLINMASLCALGILGWRGLSSFGMS